MKTIKDLKEGDILYGLNCSEFPRTIETYRISKDWNHNVKLYFDTLIGNDNDFYLNFPENLDLDEAILCCYNDATYWIYTTNIDALRPIIDAKNTWSKFTKYLDMWTQKMKSLETRKELVGEKLKF